MGGRSPAWMRFSSWNQCRTFSDRNVVNLILVSAFSVAAGLDFSRLLLEAGIPCYKLCKESHLMQHEAMTHEMTGQKAMDHTRHYWNLLLMAALSFVSMYVLMYAMVNSFDNVYNHLNQVWMAGLMAAPMVIIELLLMRSMYPDRTRNAVIMVASLVVGFALFFFIRQQTAIGDAQFLRSMIPHHSGAILMCRQASITDPEIQSLCESIISSQQSEIDQMEAILSRLQ